MHYSAKRGIAIACRPSVCVSVCLSVRPSVRLSVCNVGGSGPHRLEILKTNCTVNSSNTFALVKGHPPTPRGTWGNFGETRGWVEKVPCLSTKAEISLKRVKIVEKLLWRAYRNSPTLFRTVPSRPPTASSSLRLGVRHPTQNFNRYYLRNG